MSKFIIVGEKEKNVVGLYDVQNGGVALATLYTIKQLLDMGHEVVGVESTKPFKYTICTRKGEPSKRKENLTELMVKKSAVSFVKGIKPSRNEIKAKKETSKKRTTTLRANKKEAKEKEKAKLAKLVRFQKSKLLVVESRYSISASEYHTESSTNTVVLYAASPTALRTMKEIILENYSYKDAKNKVKEIYACYKRYGKACIKTDVDFFFDEKKMQFTYDTSYRFDYENFYDGHRGTVAFKFNEEKMAYTYRIVEDRCRANSIDDIFYGATADNCSMKGFFNAMNASKIVINSHNEPIADYISTDFDYTSSNFFF